MPYSSKWVAPEEFLTHQGVSIYCTYRYNDINDGPREFWFTTSETCGEEECDCDKSSQCRHVFDVRELPGYVAGKIKETICAAIDAGLLTTPC